MLASIQHDSQRQWGRPPLAIAFRTGLTSLAERSGSCRHFHRSDGVIFTVEGLRNRSKDDVLHVGDDLLARYYGPFRLVSPPGSIVSVLPALAWLLVQATSLPTALPRAAAAFAVIPKAAPFEP